MSEVRPCPYHGDSSAMEFSSASKKYVACLKCTNGEDSRSVWYRPIESWNNAWAWKEIDALQSSLREKEEEIDRLRTNHFEDENEIIVEQRKKLKFLESLCRELAGIVESIDKTVGLNAKAKEVLSRARDRGLV